MRGKKVSVSRRYLEVLSRGYPVYNTQEQFGDAAAETGSASGSPRAGGRRPERSVRSGGNWAMSDRKYRQRGYQDDGRKTPRAPGAQNPRPRADQPEGPRALNLMKWREVIRCARCAGELSNADGSNARCGRFFRRSTIARVFSMCRPALAALWLRSAMVTGW